MGGVNFEQNSQREGLIDMKKSEMLKAKHDRHTAYYNLKFTEYKEMETDSRSLKRLERSFQLNGLLMNLTSEIKEALLDEIEVL